MTEPPDSTFFSGEIVGNCILQRLLRAPDERREIWLAYDRKLQCPVVLKFIRDDDRIAPVLPALADFLRHTSCKQLIRVLKTLSAGNFFVAELEYAPGGSLSARRKRDGRLALGQSVYVMKEVLAALAELHANGIVHRDIKPGNVWLAEDGGIKVGDLGIARLESFPEKGPAVFGTPSAMSPEQTRDATGVDPRSDFFSLSSMMFELLSGRKRFPHGGIVETGKMIRESSPDGMTRALLPFATPDFISLLKWMAEPEPGNRPQDADSILDSLERLRLPCVPLARPETPEKEIPAE